ncbi:MAG: DUF4423 domain-containing protein [Proteobacteria bacterium]|nr:MAG: DUF4423 domain-containing protein [Pseudomonadota bacterium]
MFVYFSDNYRDVLDRYIAVNKKSRGYKSRLAEAAGCHSSYVSQVLSRAVDLTLEQAMNLASFWRFDEEETDYFLDLLLRDRAGSEKLREFYEVRLKRAREVHDLERATSARERELPADAQTIFFASWYFAAVRALALTPEYSSEERMASRLRLPLALVQEVMRQLEEMNLIARQVNRWVAEGEPFHLARSAPLHATNHGNWRQRAINNIQNRDPEALHLLHVTPLRRSDIPKIKAKLVECFEEIRQLTDGSPPEDGLALTLDFFRF